MANEAIGAPVAQQNLKADEAATGAVDDVDDDATPAGGDLKVALQQERGKRKEAARKAAALEADIAKMKPLAEEYEALLPYLPQILAQNDRNVQQQQQFEADQEALEYAEVMGITDENGRPDVGRARKAIDFHDRRTGLQVSRRVAPALRSSAQTQAESIRQRAYNVRDSQGNLYARKDAIDKVFSSIPPEHLAANPDNAVAALIMARGLGGPGVEEEQSEPVYTERPGRRPSRQASLSEESKVIARIRGRSEAEWSKLQDNPETTGWDLE